MNNQEQEKPKFEYTKFQPGDNRIRILAEPEKGVETWTTGLDGRKKPVRRRSEGDLIRAAGSTDIQVKELWVMPIYNYKTEQVEILNVTQRGIQGDLMGLKADEDWGSYLDYDIVVTRTGEGMETRYSTMPKPKKPILDEIVQEWQAAGINLGRTFEPRDAQPE